ncbi:hypothetical protein DV738_g1192, partial [Chaetothyriales sp. CBS 135597]
MSSVPARSQNRKEQDQDSVHVIFFGNELPSDDLKDLFRRLTRHCKDRRFRLLAGFVEESSAILKEEIANLPEPLRCQVPHFHSVLTLPEHGDFRDGPLGAAMESVILTVLQLSLLIGHYEGQGIEFELGKRQTTLAGLSIGLISGAAVALAKTLADLARIGAECVRVTFRVGVYVHDISSKLEAPQPDGTLLSWSHVVTAMTQEAVQDELTRFNAETKSPELSKTFISAADKNSVSVSGPPSRIKAAFQHSQALRYSKSLPLPVYDGLCHASHLYSREDIDVVIDSSRSVIPVSQPVQLPLLSSQTGQPFAADTAGELFLEICTELLTGTIYVDNVTTGLLDSARTASTASRCQVDTFRTSLIFKGIKQALETEFPERELSGQDMVAWVYTDYEERRPRSYADSKLAIVGMSCRMPGGANDAELFWELLEQGRSTLTTVPPDRFDLETHYDPTGKTENATQVPYGNFIDRPGYFDASFFNMSPKEAEQTDPMQRLALVTAYEALEMAGLVPDRTASSRSTRIGTFYGQASDDYRELNGTQNIGTYAVPGGERAFANGRIQYFFRFSGPAFNIDTACSSGLSAVNSACSSLWAGEADTVIAGGLNVITDPDNYCGLGNAHFLSKTGQCKVWDKDADGYCRADGVGSIVIKRLEDAVADNDNIIACVLSAATNQSSHAISITYPHAGAQKDNYRQVVHNAGISPLDVSYIELHGTGTQAGDAVESESVLEVFAPVAPRRHADQHLHLGAVKSNVGHGEAAAGITSMIKMLLIFQKGLIPPHIGIHTEINPAIPKDLGRRHVGLVVSKTPWPRTPEKKRLAVVNSFGAHGGNTTVLLEDAPERNRARTPSGSADSRSTHPILLSARSKKSLQGNTERLIAYLEEHPDTDLADLSYTTCARRMHHKLRIATTASSISGLQKFLRALDSKAFDDVRAIPIETPSVVLAFTGQGAFYRGMGRELFTEFPVFREQVLQLDRLVQKLGFPSVRHTIESSGEDETESPVLMQLSVVVLEIALSRFWATLGLKPAAVIGHSLGEFAALAVAGVLSEADAIFLVGRRALMTQQWCTPNTHAMLSVRATTDDIKKLIGSSADAKYEVSCRNTGHDTVIGGARDDIDAIRQNLEANSFKCVLLHIPYAFHTAQMDVVLDELEETARHVPFNAPSIPVLSPLLSTVVFDGKTINANYLRRAAREPVNFVGAVAAGQELGIVDDKTVWIDIGPHPFCAGFLRSIVPQVTVVSSCRRNEDSIATVSKSLASLHLAGVPVTWNEYYKPNEHSYQLLSLPAYSWNETNYWIPYYGTWTLEKAFARDGVPLLGGRGPVSAQARSGLQTSTIHQITFESVETTSATLHVLSDMQHPDFLDALYGHKMNNYGVATSSIWTDMSYSIGDYLYRLLVPQSKTKDVHMNLSDFEVLHAQVAKSAKGNTQPLAVEAHLDLDASAMTLAWFNVNADTGERAAEFFASGVVRFEDAEAWRAEWDRVTHLVLGRIETLEQMAEDGKASRLSKSLAYTLFKNVVDYADRYRGMDSVVLLDHEAFADITLIPERHGNWHTPPQWIDSVSHIAGMVMNGSDASNTHDFFYVTPGCDSCRLIKPLEPGAKYRSYVRMFPSPLEDHMYMGDVYILQDNIIIGMVGNLKFRRVPRLLMDRFFSPPDGRAGAAPVATVSTATTKPKPKHTAPRLKIAPKVEQNPASAIGPKALPTPDQSRANSTTGSAQNASSTANRTPQITPGTNTPDDQTEPEDDDGLIGQFKELLARETGQELSDLTDNATFLQLGVDSLMSLVLSEKFRAELGIEVKSSVFLECPTLGAMTKWLQQNI